jgi:hypothetical protein
MASSTESVPTRAPRERVMEGRPGERIAIPPFLREARMVRARRANLRRHIRLVNGLVVALHLRNCGRWPALIVVRLIIHIDTRVGTRHAAMDHRDALHAIQGSLPQRPP